MNDLGTTIATVGAYSNHFTEIPFRALAFGREGGRSKAFAYIWVLRFESYRGRALDPVVPTIT
jgi:hypothetical protein